MSNTAALPDFGQAASDYVPAAFDEDDVWIRKFPVGETLVRICPAEMVNEKGVTVYGTAAWPSEREHYDEDLKSAYPCAERFGIECVGCKHANKKVRDRSRAYFINVLDQDGNNKIYKMGVKLYKIFQGREQRALGRDASNTQPLSDRDFVIIRTGSNMNDTSYDPEPGEAYPVEGGWPDEMYDIKEILKQKYAAAIAFYSGGAGEDSEPADEPTTPAPATRISKPAAAKAAEPKEEPDPIWFKNPTAEDLEDATSEELKGFLDRREREYPARAPRARLLAEAKKVLEPPF